MVLAVVQALAPHGYAWHILAVVVVLIVLRSLAQGRTTSRERDLHSRTFLVTGAFTALGLTLLQQLAERGANVVALTAHPTDSPVVATVVALLRTAHSNQNIYAEQCCLSDPASVRAFCTRFLVQDSRLDGILFAHEYQHVPNAAVDDQHRESSSLSTFLITTLLLPALLAAPPDRDIRLITVVNPFYAAASRAFDPSFTPSPRSPFLHEAFRSLRTVILTRHLQRILDALPSPQLPKTQQRSSSVSARKQPSNIVAVSVSPGLSRVDTVSRMLNADWNLPDSSTPQRTFSWLGILLYILLLPLLLVSTKSPNAAIQSILHALFLPTPSKVLSHSSSDDATSPKSNTDNVPTPPANPTHEEILKPGALYAECAVVNLDISLPASSTADQDEATSTDDREYGGEAVGRRVWEAYEAALKVWDKEGAREPRNK